MEAPAREGAAFTTSLPGDRLLDETALTPAVLDRLFALLLLTMAGVLVFGNLERMQVGALRSSLAVAVPCIEFALLAYAGVRLTGRLPAALLPFALVTAVTYARSPLAAAAFHALSAAALVYAVRTCRPADWRGPAIGAACAALAIVGTRTGITGFDMLARMHAGNVHQDTLFHASIAAMLRHYGVASTGLNGLVETPYHYFSHLLMAGLADLSGASVLEVYGVAPWLVFAPFLVFALAAWSVTLQRAATAHLAWLWAATPVLLWFAALLLQPFFVMEHAFTSESYLVALGLFMLGQVPLFQRRLGPIDLLLVLAFSAAIAAAKISVGAVYAGLWATRLVLLRDGDWRRVAAATLLSATVTAVLIWSAAQTGVGQMRIEPLQFVRSYSWLGPQLGAALDALRAGSAVPMATAALAALALLAFVAMHFLPAWLVTVHSVRTAGVRAAMRSPMVLYSLAAVAAGMVVVSALKIPGGSAYFFTNVAFFIALPALLPFCAQWLARPAPRQWRATALAVAVAFGPGLEVLDRADNVDHIARPPNPLIQQLETLREQSPTSVVLRADAAMLADNPVHWCTARPFVFPAVSERPWVGVIEPRPRRLCAYAAYDYDRYGLAGDGQLVVEPPRLLPGMTVQGR